MADRTTPSRVQQVVERLSTEPNVWVATASLDGVPHLVPLSLAWIDDRVVVATPTETVTVRNATATGRARIALDSAADVVVIDADVECVGLSDADQSVLDVYASRVGWDPRSEPSEWTLLTLTPRRVQAWNSVAEIEGRTIMSHGVWRGE